MRYAFIKTFLLLLVLLSLCVLTHAQDKKTLSVYDEYSKTYEYFWFPAGWMPDGEGISFEEDFNQNCRSGETCIKIGYNCIKRNFVGIYWLAYGSWFGPGINLYKHLNVDENTSIMLTFWARGDQGQEVVQFRVGGVKDGKDSIEPATKTDWIRLTATWKHYKIDLTGKDLSNVVGGFCWFAYRANNPGKEEISLYLDDIKFEEQ